MSVIFILLIIIAGLLVLYAITYKKLSKELALSHKIRQGYERKCNTFRIKYTMLSKLEHSDQIIKKVKELGKPLYIYGGGVIGDKLLAILKCGDGPEVLRVIESSELKSNPDIGKQLRKEALVVVTPMFDYDNIVQLLLQCHVPQECIIGLDELFI